MESTGEMDEALKYYEQANDILSLVRVHCYCGNVEKVKKVFVFYLKQMSIITKHCRLLLLPMRQEIVLHVIILQGILKIMMMSNRPFTFIRLQLPMVTPLGYVR